MWHDRHGAASLSGQKLTLVLTMATVAICVITVRSVGRMYPTSAVSITISVAVIIGLVYRNIVSPRWGLIGIVVLSTFYRSYLFVYPASYFGADADGFALVTEQVLQTGHTSNLVGISNFYQSAPNYFIFGSASSLITGLPVRYALTVVPVIIGIIVPLVAYIVAHRLDFDPRVGVLAAAVTTVIPAVLSPNLIAQSLATPIAMTIAVLILTGNATRRSETLLTAVSLYLVILYTHKLAPTLLAVSFIIVGIINIGRSRIFGQQFHLTSTGLDFATVFAVTSYLQWVFTDIESILIIKGHTIIGVEVATDGQSVLTGPPSAAQPLFESSYIPIFLNLGYLIPLLFLAGIGWMLLMFRPVNRFEDSFVLGLVIIPVALNIGTVFGIVPDNPSRFIFFAIPFVAAFSAITIYKIAAFVSNSQVSVVVVVILLLALTVPQALARGPPDAPGERKYLTSAEMSAQEWVNQRIEGPVATDGFYSGEPSPFLIRKYARDSGEKSYESFNFEPATARLLNNTLHQGQNCQFAVRQSATTYSLEGTWELTYDLDSITKRQQAIYSSGNHGTVIGKQRNC